MEARAPIRVLLVEDNPGDQRLVRETLRACGPDAFELDCVASAAGCVEYLAGKAPDVLLLDLTLPDSAGLQTVELVRGHAPGLPVLVLTGLEREDWGLEAVRRGAQDYLLKGRLEPEVLARALRYAIERNKLLRELQEALSRVNTLQRLLPVCAHCSRIRDADGSWITVERYMRLHSAAEISHGICLDCMRSHYGSLNE